MGCNKVESHKGKSTTRAKNKYNAQNYDSLHIVVPKGRKQKVMVVAKESGESLNGYVSKAIDERVVRNGPVYTKAYTIIAGVNGTGKSSFSGVLKSLAENRFIGEIVDIDKITTENKVFPLEGSKIAMLRIAELLENEKCLTFETTLEGNKTEVTAATAKELGYYVRLYYIGLDTPEECLRRINSRVARGGHNIGDIDVRRRFSERWKSIKKVLVYCDEAYFFDNENGFVEVAEFLNGTFILKSDSPPAWILDLAKYLKRHGTK